MKKIVALVLSLVMALSLCTVAFAAIKDGTEFYDAQSTTGAKVYTYHAAKDNGAGEESWLAYFTCEGQAYAVGDANGKTLWVDGKTKADITVGDAVENGELSYWAKGEVVKASEWSCTTDKYDAGYKYVGKDGTTKYARDAKSSDPESDVFQILVGNEIKKVVQQNVLKGMHALVVPKDGPKELDVGVYEAYCVACKKNVKISHENINGAGFLYEDGYAWNINKTYSVPSGYVKLGDYDQEATWYVIGTAEATKPADGVTSAKTFDAGVAMYVGMSLLSVAGGAVVIGKKKEF